MLAGKFRVDRVLGRGGMGIVLAATHLNLQQRVALKLLLPDLVANRDVVERFLREARASAQLRGEHVCRVSDVGTLDNGAPYIVMELLEGRDLASIVSANGPLPVPVACQYVLHACVGVAEAHALGIVHRDLKPANLFLTSRPDGSPLIKVLDFGIAKAQRDTNFSLTNTTTVLGSPGYMSPEQLRSTKDADRRSDIWSLGVILYELVSGKPPFSASSITELALRIAMDPVPPLLVRMPDGFETIVMRCLAKEPDDRYPDLANLAHALAAYGGNGAWELASAVTRLVGGPRHARPSAPPPYASSSMAPPTMAVPPTIASTGMQPMHVPGSAPVLALPQPTSPPTTMRHASGSMITTRPSNRRWGIVAGVASAIVAGVVTAIVVAGAGGDGTSTAGETRPAAPPPSDPAKTEPAKGYTTADDTKPIEPPPPAKTEPAKTEPVKTEPAKTEPAKTEDVAKVDEPKPLDGKTVKKDPKKPPIKKPTTKSGKDTGDDFTNSRF